MITHGHSVFDYVSIRDGFILHLDQHLARNSKFLENAMIDIEYRESIRDIAIEAVRRSGARDGSFRYYISGNDGSGQPVLHLLVEGGMPIKPLDGCSDLYYRFQYCIVL
jgi:hypothetical protein